MKRVGTAILLLAPLFSAANAAGMRASIALSPDYQGAGSEFIISWDAIPGKSYNVEATAALDGTWTELNPDAIAAQSDVETYRHQTSDPIQFYRVRKLDTEPPEVAYLNPSEGAIGVGREEPLTAHLADESGVDPSSVAFSVGSGPTIGVDDPRLSYSDGILTYTPGGDEFHGSYAETITVSLSASDTLGHRLENYIWPFKLELEPVLAATVLIIDAHSPLTLLSAEGQAYTFSYSGDSPGVSVGDVLVSTNVENPYKARALTVTDHPESHTVDVLTEDVSLGELFEQGSLRAKSTTGEELPKGPTLKEISSTPLIGAKIPLDGLTIYQDSVITVEVISGFIEFIPDLTVGAEFGLFRLKSFDAEVTGTVNFDATVRAMAGQMLSCEYEKNLKTFTKTYFTMVGVVPVLVDVVLEFNIGFTAEAQAAGWVEAGFSSSRSITVGAKWRNGKDGKWYKIHRESGYVNPVAPTWQIEGGVNIQPYVEAKLTVYLEKLGGPSVNLKPYLELDGYFQLNPFAYEWGLYAGLTSDLAMELRGWDDDWGELPSWRLLDLRWTLLEETYPRDWQRPPPTDQWSKTYGGSYADGACSVRQTSDGGYIVAGYTWSFGAGKGDAWVIKTDAHGNEQWRKTFGANDAHDEGRSVRQTSDSGYIIAACTGIYRTDVYPWVWEWNRNAYLIKTGSDGNEEWSKTFGGSDTHEEAWAVEETSDGGYIIAGETDSSAAGGVDMYLVKTDAQGNEQWSKTFGGSADDVAYSVQQTSDGGYILVGWTESFGAGGKDVYLVKTDAEGNERWSKTFGTDGWDEARSVSQTSDGGYILVGKRQTSLALPGDVYLIKTDAQGNEKWSRPFGGEAWDEAWSVQQTSDGGYIVAGRTWSFGAGSVSNAYLIKTDSRGNQQWSRTFGDDRYQDMALSVQQTSDGSYIVAGETMGFHASGSDVYLIKTDRFGNAPPPR